MAKKFENIIIASDIDGTYLGLGSRIVPRNDEAIAYFKENGGSFTIATGRIPAHTLIAVPHIASLCNLPVVTVNGACLYDFKNGVELEAHPTPSELAVDLARFVKNAFPDVGVRASTDSYMIAADTDNPLIARDLSRLTSDFNKIVPFDGWCEYRILKLAARGDAEQLTHVREALRKRYEGVLEISRSSASMLDIQLVGMTKASLLQKLVKREFTDKGKSAVLCTVGDYDNDIEMHSVADISACPENASENVKSICKLHLCHHDKGVIADLVEYLDNSIR